MTNVSAEVQKRLDERARAKSDRLFLAREVLGYDFVPEVHTELFAQYPQFTEDKSWVEQSAIKNVLILWPRGHYKTTAVVVVVIQAILDNPDVRVLLMQGSIGVTKTLLKQIVSHFDGSASNSRLAELFPEFCGTKKELSLSALAFTTPARRRKQLAQATVTVASPRSIKTGQHYDLGIFDDLVNDQNYRNPKLLAKVEQDFNDCQPLIDPGCYRFVSGTRYAFGDLYENIMRRNKGEWTVSLKTCWTESGEVRFPQCKLADGRWIGFTREMLEQIMRDTPAIFASQYLNQPVLEGSQLFTEQKLLGACIADVDTPALSTATLFVDISSGNTDSDDSVILAAKLDVQARLYVADGIGGLWTTPDLATQVIAMALKHRPLKIMLEKSAAGQVFAEYLKVIARARGVMLPIDFIKVDNQKDAKSIRVSALEGLISSRRLLFVAGMPCWAKMFEQFKQWPRGRHDDYPDTVALIAQHFGSQYIPFITPKITRNPMIAMLERDTQHDIVTHTETEPIMSAGNDLGSDFCC